MQIRNAVADGHAMDKKSIAAIIILVGLALIATAFL